MHWLQLLTSVNHRYQVFKIFGCAKLAPHFVDVIMHIANSKQAAIDINQHV